MPRIKYDSETIGFKIAYELIENRIFVRRWFPDRLDRHPVGDLWRQGNDTQSKYWQEVGQYIEFTGRPIDFAKMILHKSQIPSPDKVAPEVKDWKSSTITFPWTFGSRSADTMKDLIYKVESYKHKLYNTPYPGYSLPKNGQEPSNDKEDNDEDSDSFSGWSVSEPPKSGLPILHPENQLPRMKPETRADPKNLLVGIQEYLSE
ncbi:MAG: hypothetical protein M1834_008154 [Cirrosporium novae-zelandiae]|nr:MAG: hypothetical protein M1834_008154 [Cirrosporium novae-zelandiae]